MIYSIQFCSGSDYYWLLFMFIIYSDIDWSIYYYYYCYSYILHNINDSFCILHDSSFDGWIWIFYTDFEWVVSSFFKVFRQR